MASPRGLEIVDLARKKKRWTKYDENWYSSAGTSPARLRQFWQRSLIPECTFIKICQAVGVDWQEIAEAGLVATRRQDWGEAPNAEIFYSRTPELATLEKWILQNNSRLVAILGMAGIGKTALSVKLGKQIADNFEYAIWRSLHNSPPLTELLADLIEFFSDGQLREWGDAAPTDAILRYLQTRRCLIILDGVETLLETGQLAGKYREGYQEYGRLFKQVAESCHQSAIVLTSSEKSREIALLEGPTVRCLQLTGLSPESAREILREKGLVEEPEWSELITRYGGNPLALKIVGSTIKEVFAGKVSNFLRQNTLFLGQIELVIEQQVDRLSKLETKLICQLASAEQAVSLEELLHQIAITGSSSDIITAVESLAWRSLIEKVPSGNENLFALQPVVKKYVIRRFGSNCCIC